MLTAVNAFKFDTTILVVSKFWAVSSILTEHDMHFIEKH